MKKILSLILITFGLMLAAVEANANDGNPVDMLQSICNTGSFCNNGKH